MIAIEQLNNEAIKERAEKIYRKLIEADIDVLFDNREDISAGEKFADADLIGIPVRLVVSEKTDNKIEWKRRDRKEIELLTTEEVAKRLKNV